MLSLILKKSRDSILEILCLGAHSDDIEIGCGGTILRLIQEYPMLKLNWIIFSAKGVRAAEAQRSAELFLKQVKQKQVIVKEFREGYFPYIGSEIKDYFEQLKHESTPDLIFTHYGQDCHQDHKLVSELTWNTFRDHTIFEYEIPKYDGGLGSPNLFVHLDKALCDMKIENILECFKTQENRHWFSAETFYSTLRIRGIESRSPSYYAEGFYSRKIVM